MIIFLAGTNKGKLGEINSFLLDQKISASLPPAQINVEENGSTYHQNAYLKAMAYWNEYKVPILSDDSGLELEDFPDLLGLQTANFRTDLDNSFDKCNAILEVFKNSNKNFVQSRIALFRSVLCFKPNKDEVYFFEGQIQGVISKAILGDGGFGYDPIFIPKQFVEIGQTLAQLSEWKSKNSHRAKSLKEFSQFLKNYSIKKSETV